MDHSGPRTIRAMPTDIATDHGPAASRADTGRARAAETKRTRSRERLVAAAADLFAERGWHRTRVEDIADRAGLSVATAYNHFPTKVHLLTAASAPLLQPVIDSADRDVADGVPALEAVHRSVHLLARIARENASLTQAVLAALPDIFDMDRSDPERGRQRVRVEYDRPLITIIEAGQRRGELAPHLDAEDVAMLVTGTLLLRVLTRPTESAAETGDTLEQLLRRGMLA